MRARYEAALLEILGRSWRTWWLDQKTTGFKTVDEDKLQEYETTHREQLEKREARRTNLRCVDYNRNPEKSFLYCEKYDSYNMWVMGLGAVLLLGFLVRFFFGPFDLGSNPWIQVGLVWVTFIALAAWVYLLSILIRLYHPSYTTRYVELRWDTQRDFLLKSGLVKGVTDILFLEQGPDFLEELEYSAERQSVDTEVSNAIHHAYREIIIQMIADRLKADMSKAIDMMRKKSGEHQPVLFLFEEHFKEHINVSPLFFVPHSPKDFRGIVYPEAFERLKS